MGRGFGIAAAVDDGVIRQVAKAAEEAGYSSFWVNDTPGNDGLEALTAAAADTDNIKLGVGVISLDRREANAVIQDVERMDLPQDRLWLGIGSAQRRGGLDKIRNGAATIRFTLDARVIVAALGPKMCTVAGEVADGVLFNWVVPDYAAQSSERVASAAELAGRNPPSMMAYVRCGLLPEAEERINAEADRYAGIPAYARHFERQGVDARHTVVAGRDASALQERIREFEAVLDETVIRAITPDDDAPAILKLVEACKP